MKLTCKLLFILMAALGYAYPTCATMIEEKDLYFKPDIKSLMKGNIQFSYNLLTPKELRTKFPEAFELDSTLALREKKVKILMTKSIFVVNKAVGFFDHEHMKDEKYLAHIMGQQKVEKTGDSTFKVTVPGESGHHYMMKTYFDSDDISTLPNTRTIAGTTIIRKLDIISQSASSIVLKQFTDFSKYSHSGTSIYSYISLKDGKTLVIGYRLIAIKKHFAIDDLLKKNYLNETATVRNLMGSFQE